MGRTPSPNFFKRMNAGHASNGFQQMSALENMYIQNLQQNMQMGSRKNSTSKLNNQKQISGKSNSSKRGAIKQQQSLNQQMSSNLMIGGNISNNLHKQLKQKFIKQYGQQAA